MNPHKSNQLLALEQRIEEVRSLLHELEDSASTLRKQEQHHEVNHLENYLNETDKEVEALSVFKEEVVKEIKGMVDRIKERIHPPSKS